MPLEAPSTPAAIAHLIELGLVVESSTFPDVPMTQAIPKVLDAPLMIQKLAAPLSMTANDLRTKLEELNDALAVLPHDNKQWQLTAAVLVLNVVVVVAVSMRVHARRKVTDRLWHDDWWAIVGMVCFVVSGILYNIATLRAGGCKHLWDVSFNDFKLWMMLVTICEMLFAFTMIPVKISFLVFYHSLSPDRWYRRSIFLVGIVTVAVTIAGVFLFAFQCRPFDYWNHAFDMKCFDQVTIFAIWGGFIAATDIMLLLLPVRKVSQLNLRKKEKIIIIGMFSAGGLICIASVLRVITFVRVFVEVDKTILIFGPGLWSQMELAMGILVSCLPALKHLLHRQPNSDGKRSPCSFSNRLHSLLRKKNANMSVTEMSAVTSNDDGEACANNSTMRSGGLRSWGSRFIITRTTATNVTTKSGMTTFARDEEEMILGEGSRGGLSAPKHYNRQSLRGMPSSVGSGSSRLAGVMNMDDLEKIDTKD